MHGWFLPATGTPESMEASIMSKRYRSNVAAILQDGRGRLLIGQRSDHPECWQFPQGGVDDGESPEAAVRREVLEEVGIGPEDYEVVRTSGPHRYDFPWGPNRRGFSGQEQIYFLCRLRADRETPLSAEKTCGEFADFRWVPTAGFPVHLAPPMKQEVYRAVLADFFGADPEAPAESV